MLFYSYKTRSKILSKLPMNQNVQIKVNIVNENIQLVSFSLKAQHTCCNDGFTRWSFMSCNLLEMF